MSKTKDKAEQKKIRLVKLASGITLLASIRTLKGELMELTHAMEVIIVPDRSGKTMVSLVDFIPASISEEVIVKRDPHIVTTAMPDPRVVALYEQAINPSPVVQPPEQQLVLPAGV